MPPPALLDGVPAGAEQNDTQMSNDHAGYYVQLTGGEQFVMFRTTEGRVCIFIFKTREAASDFIAARGKASEWEVGALLSKNLKEWVEGAYAQGVTHFSLQNSGDVNEAEYRVSPLSRLILIMDMEGG